MTTTLRLSSTNEVSTVDNYAIASSRIINHNRSPNALVNLNIKFKLQITQEQMEAFYAKLRSYTKDRQGTWKNIATFRQNRFDIMDRIHSKNSACTIMARQELNNDR